MNNVKYELIILKTISIIHIIYGLITLFSTIVLFSLGYYASLSIPNIVFEEKISSLAIIVFAILNIIIGRKINKGYKKATIVSLSFIIIAIMLIISTSIYTITFPLLLIFLWFILLIPKKKSTINKKTIMIGIIFNIVPLIYSINNYLITQKLNNLILITNTADYDSFKNFIVENPNFIKTDGRNIFKYFIANDDKMMKNLILAGADINNKDSNGNTALHYAVLDYRINVFRLLLANGAKTNIKNSSGKTPLQLALNIKNSGQAGLGNNILNTIIKELKKQKK